MTRQFRMMMLWTVPALLMGLVAVRAQEKKAMSLSHNRRRLALSDHFRETWTDPARPAG